MTEVRVLAHTSGDGTVLVTVEGDELPSGGFDPSLYQSVRIYHADRDELTGPLWLGSALKFLGGYLQQPAVEAAEEERVLARVVNLLAACRGD